jgi:hypothetical protein
MSLINDALKRASTRPAAAPPPGGPPLQPAESSSDQKNSLPIVLGIVGIGALLMAGAFWLKSKGTAITSGEQVARQQPALAAKTQVASAAPVESSPVAPNPIEHASATLQKLVERNNDEQPIATVPTNSQTLPVLTATITPAPPAAAAIQPPVTTITPTVTAAVTPPAPEPVKPQPVTPAIPKFHLQAIYYRMHGPTVLINGKTLKVGDEVNGAKLIDIERTSAEIEYQGARQKLTMH